MAPDGGITDNPVQTISKMRPFFHAVLFCLAGVFATASVRAEDSVSIRYLPGYPLPSRSIERLDVRVARIAPPTGADDQAIDRFFASVQATLNEHGVAGDWQSVIPDAPAIEISVELSGRRTRLASAHVALERTGNVVVTERGVESLNQRSRDAVLAQQSEAFRRHRSAFERLLSLTLARVRAQLSP